MTGLIPRTFVDDLLLRVDVVEFITARVPLRKRGANYIACCPFHQEKTPSFTVHPTKQFYHCFGCGKSGNAISFAMEYDGLDFVEAIETLAAHAGMVVPREQQVAVISDHQNIYSLLQQADQFFRQQLRNHPEAIEYLKNRGLTGNIAKQFGIGFAPPGWDNILRALAPSHELQQQLLTAGMLIKKDEGGFYDRFRARIMFPIRDRKGRAIAFGGRVLDDSTPKYLNSPETPIFHKGEELYGLYEVRAAHNKISNIIIVEGYMDVVALAQHGINNAVATLGTATSSIHIQKLLRLVNELIFCFDGDQAGLNAARRALEISLPMMQDDKQIRFLFLPEGEDPDSLVRKEGAEQFVARMQQAMPLADFFFKNLQNQVADNSLQSQAQIASLAITQLNKLPDIFFKKLLLQQLAKKLRMDESKLQKLASQQQRQTVNPLASRRTSAMRLAVALLIQYPELIQWVPTQEQLTTLEIPGISLFAQLAIFLQEHPGLNTAAILEHWRGVKEGLYLQKLAILEHVVPVDGVEEEFKGIMSRLLEKNKEQAIERLLQKASFAGLSDSERTNLHELILEQAETK